jgi:hypothetical protein
MTDDVFSFDAFLNKNGGKRPSTNSIKDKFLKEVEEESIETLNEPQSQEKEEEDLEDIKKPEFDSEQPVTQIDKKFFSLDQGSRNKKEVVEEYEDEVVEDEVVEDEVVEITNENSSFQIVEEDDDFYKLYQDKNEEFSCDIMIEGSSPEETYARIILESENWSLVFPGEIRNGKCIVPIKKLNILKEGEIGNIKLEVVAEGNLFIPWEDKFKVKLSKKVTVNINESRKPVKKPIISNKIGVRVNVK